MSEYILQDQLYLGITPAGAYYATQSTSEEAGRSFLQRLLRTPESPLFNQTVASEYSGLPSKSALEFIHWLQSAGLIFGLEAPEAPPQSRLEALLPDLLPSLSDIGKVTLAEAQGFYLGATGFTHEAAEELAAMTTELTASYNKYSPLLNGNLRLKQRAWGLVDGTGNSEIGFWPVFIDDHVFTLIIEGMPQFNQPSFKELIWGLSIRYDTRLP